MILILKIILTYLLCCALFFVAWCNWWSAHWKEYGAKKAEIIATGKPVEYTLTPAPWTIWEISE